MHSRSLAYLMLTAAPALLAQEWDASASGKGWARVDRDGSCVFLDPEGRALRSWVKDGGLLGSVDLSKAPGMPERWVFDSLGHAWVVMGTQLLHVEKGGKVDKKETLPGPVSDVAWDTRGFVLSYKGAAAFLEKRDYKTGAVIWSLGKKAEGTAEHPIAITDEGSTLSWSADGFRLSVVDAKGKAVGEMVFTSGQGAAAQAPADSAARGPLRWWLGHNVVFSAIPGSQVPASGISGLVLVRMDLAGSALTFLPTGVTEDHQFLGLTDTEAVLEKPGGGLVFVPVN